MKFFFFFLFLFSDYFCSVCPHVVGIVLVGVIILSLHFSILSLCCCIDTPTLSSMLASPLPPSFLDTYCQVTFYL